MHRRIRPPLSLWVTVLAATALVLVSCGGDEPAGDATVSDGAAPATLPDGPAVEGAVSDDDLLVPRAYLQGEWCDSDGQSWAIEGDIARVEDGSGGVAELPVDLAFIDNLDNELASQTDDEFVVAGGGEETTFTRGSC